MTDKYILDGKTPVPEPDVLKWGAWFEDHFKSCVAHTEIGDGFVSTVFLALDHSFGEGRPVLFETMVFGLDGFGDEQVRYSTWEEAEAGHAAMVAKVSKQAA